MQQTLSKATDSAIEEQVKGILLEAKLATATARIARLEAELAAAHAS